MTGKAPLSLDLDGESYIDRVETKIESPTAEVISPTSGKSISTTSGVLGSSEKNVENRLQQQDDYVKFQKENWIDRTETKISDENQSSSLKRTIGQNSSAHNEIPINSSKQETSSSAKKSKKVGSYEITSATSFFLFSTKNSKNTKNKTDSKQGQVEVKEKENSMLYQMGVEAVGKPVESKKVAEYPLPIDNHEQSNATKNLATEDSRAANARAGWASIKQESGDIENFLLEEDDDENVIIHLGSEFSQDTLDGVKEEITTTVDMEKYEGSEKKAMTSMNVLYPNGKKMDEKNIATEEDTTLEEIKPDKLTQLGNVLSKIQENSMHSIEKASTKETSRPNYTTQVSAENKGEGLTAQEDRTSNVKGSEGQNLGLKQHMSDNSSQGSSKNIHLNVDNNSQEHSTKETVGEQCVQENISNTYSANKAQLSQQAISLANEKQSILPVKSIEVERKFRIPKDCRQKLKALGATMAKEVTFTDEYYDDLKYKMTLSDCWLRKRNKNWEFKIPPRHITKSDTSSQYAEITSEKEIVKHLCKLYNYPKLTDDLTMDILINELKLDVFATFMTTRQTYHLPNCTIDLDIADFGFEVGEIEVMVSDHSRITEALCTIDDMAKKLGVLSVVKVPGKMDTYLEEFCPEHFDMLKLAGIL